jgi:transcriptional regulator with XRE-family HTH domain
MGYTLFRGEASMITEGGIAMTLGERLKRQRERRGLTQRALAQAAKVPQPLISMLEAGKRQQTSTAFLRGLAIVLGCTTDYLLGMYDDKESEEKPAAVEMVGT